MPAQILKLITAVAGDMSDADLLGRFVASRDEAAFTELVRRHGRSVYRVCCRLAGASCADDAFQSTFLVLACRASKVRKAASVGSWLIGVAGRVARQMRYRTGHSQPEVDVLDASSPNPDSRLLTSELSSVLEFELTQLPDTLRTPVVLCLVEGMTQEQAAMALGGSVRTLRRRLDRAKILLRLRLERRGVAPTAALAVLSLFGTEATALPPGVAERTVNGVYAFLAGGPITPAAVVAKGVVGTMAKLKASALVGVAAAVMIGLSIGWADDGTPSASPAGIPLSKARPTSAELSKRTSIRFAGPVGLKITWQLSDGKFNDESTGLTVPKEHTFLQGQVYRLRVTQIKPDYPGKKFYPTLEVAEVEKETQNYLDHESVPVAFTAEDFRQAADGNLVVKVVYLPNAAHRDLAPVGAEEIASPRLEPGVDPVAEARKRGTILVVVRLGNIDLENPVAPASEKSATTIPPQPSEPIPRIRGSAATHQTRDFVVHAPTAVMARAIANEAQHQRKAIAEKWFGSSALLGGAVPEWKTSCEIKFTIDPNRRSGATTFSFGEGDQPALRTVGMELRGDFMDTLTVGLPHEVAHVVLAAQFGKPVPRWADEGLALTVEPAEEQAKLDTTFREHLAQGRAIRLHALLSKTEYPRDTTVLYSQGHSLVRFLLARKPKMFVLTDSGGKSVLRNCQGGFEPAEAGLLAFLRIGMEGKKLDSWQKAAKDVYGFESVDALEAAWLDRLKKPENKLMKLPISKPGEIDLIPPTKLPNSVPQKGSDEEPDRIPPMKMLNQ